MSASRLDSLTAYLKEDPNDPFLQFAFAMELLKLGHVPMAMSRFESLVQEHPDYVGTYYHLARLYISSRRYDDARATIATGIEVANVQGESRASSELRQLLDELDEE